MSSPHYGGRQGLAGAFHSLAALAAIVGTVFFAPHLWPLIEPKVWVWLTNAYSREVSTWLLPGCQIAMWALTFLVLRLGLSAALMALTVLITRRML